MTETRASGAYEVWHATPCPFPIEYSRAALEAIRLAVVDAFFSFPRGGVEIGGVLLGRFAGGRLTIIDSEPLECEHALGPSFTLSERDEARLEALLTRLRKAGGTNVVGWYHSHTRSEIGLSEADLGIYNRYFPEQWQVALVLRPSMFQPVRGGFFFREAEGQIAAAASYQEFELSPGVGNGAASERQVAAPAAAAAVAMASPEPMQPEPPPVAIAAPAPRPAAIESPQVYRPEPRLAARRWRIAGVLAVSAIVSAVAFQGRHLWLPAPPPAAPAAQPAPSPALSMSVLDSQGQMLIRWDRSSPAIAHASDGLLTVSDNGDSKQIALDRLHLEAGAFVYIRHGQRVDARLEVHEQQGSSVQAVATFLGALPETKEAADTRLVNANAELRRERDTLTAENERLRNLLQNATGKAKQLQDEMDRQKKAPVPVRKRPVSGADIDPLE